jgi:gamma-glutamyltranspeptidase
MGNMVSWIQSLYMGFGSGITAGRTGVQLQNQEPSLTRSSAGSRPANAPITPLFRLYHR